MSFLFPLWGIRRTPSVFNRGNPCRHIVSLSNSFEVPGDHGGHSLIGAGALDLNAAEVLDVRGSCRSVDLVNGQFIVRDQTVVGPKINLNPSRSMAYSLDRPFYVGWSARSNRFVRNKRFYRLRRAVPILLQCLEDSVDFKLEVFDSTIRRANG